jgi:hypothetical protein
MVAARFPDDDAMAMAAPVSALHRTAWLHAQEAK